MRSALIKTLSVLLLIATPVAAVEGICFVSNWGPSGDSPTGTINLQGQDGDPEGSFKTQVYYNKKGPIYTSFEEYSFTWNNVNFQCHPIQEDAEYILTMWGNNSFETTGWQETSAPCGGGGGPV